MGANAIHVTDASFDEDVKNSPVPVVLDCWATWCGPCIAAFPTMNKIIDLLNQLDDLLKIHIFCLHMFHM